MCYLSMLRSRFETYLRSKYQHRIRNRALGIIRDFPGNEEDTQNFVFSQNDSILRTPLVHSQEPRRSKNMYGRVPTEIVPHIKKLGKSVNIFILPSTLITQVVFS